MPSVCISASYPHDDVNFGKPKANNNGGYNVEVSIGDSDDSTLLQTPRMRCPFGISTNRNNENRKDLDLSFNGMDTNKSFKDFYDCIKKFDTKAIDFACENSKLFFKKELDRAVITEFYMSGIKKSNNPNYADTFKIKLPYLGPNPEKNRADGKYLVSFWNTEQEEVNATELDKGDSASVLVQPGLFWVANKQFGVTWSGSQVRVHKRKVMKNYAFKDTPDDKEASEEEEVEYAEEEVEEEEEF